MRPKNQERLGKWGLDSAQQVCSRASIFSPIFKIMRIRLTLNFPPTLSRRTVGGFTLVEALISVVILAFAAMAMGGLYHSGLMAMSIQADQTQFDNHLRSQMEILLSEKFDSPNLVSGTKEITVNGQTQTLTWNIVTPYDIDGDGVPDADVKHITVTLDNRSLTTLMVDSDGQVEPI